MAGESKLSVSLSSRQVLDCKVCKLPLTIPVYQCRGGHTACNSCRKSLGSKCATCGLEIDSGCSHLEEIIKSLTLPCPNKDYGCKVLISYCNTRDHAKSCFYQKYPCPEPGCQFNGLSSKLSDHFCGTHSSNFVTFEYDEPFDLYMGKNQRIYMLKEEDHDDVFVLSNEPATCGGRKIYVIFMSQRAIISDTEVQLTVTVDGSDFTFSGPAHTARSISDKSQPPTLLYISGGFLGSEDSFSVQLVIRG